MVRKQVADHRKSRGIQCEGAGGVRADVPEEELELGYHVFHPYRRQGYAEEACRAILDYAKNELDCPVCACAAGENTASIRLLRKLKVKYFTVCNM